MALLDTLTLTKTTARGTSSWSWVVPVDATVDTRAKLADHLAAFDGATPLAYEADFVTHELYAGGAPCRLVDVTIDGTGSASSDITLEVHDAAQSQPSPTLVYQPAIEDSLNFPGALRLMVSYEAVQKYARAGGLNRKRNEFYEVIDLATPTQRFYHRRGDLRTTTIDRHLLKSGLELVISVDYRAGEEEIAVQALIHNGGTGEALSDDIEIRSIRWLLVNGVVYTPAEWDPVGTSGNQGYLVAPATNIAGTHIIAQRAGRLVCGTLHLEGAAPIKHFAGQGIAPQAFQDYEAAVGGTALPVLGSPAATAAQLDADYADEKDRALTLQDMRLGFSTGSQPPLSAFWLTGGVRYGGATSGVGIEPFMGAEQANTGEADHWELLRIAQTRFRCRQATLVTDGIFPAEPWGHLNASGESEWDHANGHFLWSGSPRSLRDDPYGFSDVWSGRTLNHPESPVVTTKVPGGGAGVFFLPSGQGVWRPIDDEHLVRAYSYSLGLAWYTNDPMAWYFLHNDAYCGMMTFGASWPERGARRFPPPDETHPAPGVPKTGMVHGREIAWTGYLMAHVRAHDVPGPLDTQFDDWIDRLVDVIDFKQMANGLTSCRNYGKEATQPPFGDESNAHWWVFRNTQHNKFGIALWAARQLRPASAHRMATIDPILDDLADGLYNYTWQQDVWDAPGGVRTGPLAKVVLGPNVPVVQPVRMFTAEEQAPAPLGFEGPTYGVFSPQRKGARSSNYRYKTWQEIPDPSPYTGGEILLSSGSNSSDPNMPSTFLGIADAVGAAEAQDMYRKMADEFPAGTWGDIKTAVEGWTPHTTSNPPGKRMSTWAPTLGYVQKLHP